MYVLFLAKGNALSSDRFAFDMMKVRKEFSSEVDSAMAAFRGLSVDSSSGQADLTQLFRIATHEAKKSRVQNRILRVVSVAYTLFCKHLSLVLSGRSF